MFVFVLFDHPKRGFVNLGNWCLVDVVYDIVGCMCCLILSQSFGCHRLGNLIQQYIVCHLFLYLDKGPSTHSVVVLAIVDSS